MSEEERDYIREISVEGEGYWWRRGKYECIKLNTCYLVIVSYTLMPAVDRNIFTK